MPKANAQRQNRRHHPQYPRNSSLRGRITPCLYYRWNSQQRIREYRKHRRDPGIIRPVIQSHTRQPKQQIFPVPRRQRKIPAQQGRSRYSKTPGRRTQYARQAPLPALADHLRNNTRSHQQSPAQPRQYAWPHPSSNRIPQINDLRTPNNYPRHYPNDPFYYIHYQYINFISNKILAIGVYYPAPAIPLKIIITSFDKTMVRRSSQNGQKIMACRCLHDRSHKKENPFRWRVFSKYSH